MGWPDDFTSIVLSPNRKGRTPSNQNVVALIVHDEEYPERPDAAEQVARFFANPATQASTTGVIDNDSIVGCVPYGETAWHSGAGDPWNYACEGYEHSGYAHQSRDEWLDEYGVAMLELSAAHFAKRALALGIPIRRIDASQLRRAVRENNPAIGGICGHDTITQAAGVRGGHSDPGPNFPWDYFIDRVLAHAGQPTPTPTPTPPEDDMPYSPEQLAAIVRDAARVIVRDPDTSGMFILDEFGMTRTHLTSTDDVVRAHVELGIRFRDDGAGGCNMPHADVVIYKELVPTTTVAKIDAQPILDAIAANPKATADEIVERLSS